MKYLILLLLVGCIETKEVDYGMRSEVFCFNGGIEVFHDVSIGPVEIKEGGIYYTSENGSDVYTSAECFFVVKAE